VLLEPPAAPVVAPVPEVAPPDVPGAVGEAVPDVPGAVGEAVPEVPGAEGETVDDPGWAGVVPDTPVAGGVVTAPGPVPGAHGTAVPLVPVGIGALAAPVLRAVVFESPVGVAPGEGVALAVGAAPGEGVELVVGLEPMVAVLFAPEGVPLAPVTADCERGPASVAVFTLLFPDVVVPVELLA